METQLKNARQKETENLFTINDFVLQSFNHLYLHGNSGMIITDYKGIILDSNTAFSRITGYSHDEVIGHTPRILLYSGHQNTEFYKEMWDTINNEGFWLGRIWDCKKSKEVFPVLLSIKKIKINDKNNNFYFSGVYTETTGLAGEQPENLRFYEQ
jgi:PAS domain S-box-containing protein